MEKFKFQIDVKSLFYGLVNDTSGGHTATVSTNLKQGIHEKPELPLFNLLRNEISVQGNDELINACASKSKSVVRINKVLYFKEIFVNGVKLETDAEFGMYIKEEINPDAIQYGRLKLHYPLSLKYYDLDHDIDNRKIIEAIKKTIGNYAFIVNYFVFYFEKPRLDIDLTIIGEEGIPYSKVFVDQKGTGQKFNKLFTEQADSYDYEIVAVKRYLGKDITPFEYLNLIPQFEEKSTKLIYDHLKNNNFLEINIVINKYPYSPVDLECYLNKAKYYIIIKSTATNIDYFFLSKHEWQLLCANPNTCKVCLVKKVCSETPVLEFYDAKQIGELNKEFTSMRVYK